MKQVVIDKWFPLKGGESRTALHGLTAIISLLISFVLFGGLLVCTAAAAAALAIAAAASSDRKRGGNRESGDSGSDVLAATAAGVSAPA